MNFEQLFNELGDLPDRLRHLPVFVSVGGEQYPITGVAALEEAEPPVILIRARGDTLSWDEVLKEIVEKRG